jgi:hypothetical protein
MIVSFKIGEVYVPFTIVIEMFMCVIQQILISFGI